MDRVAYSNKPCQHWVSRQFKGSRTISSLHAHMRACAKAFDDRSLGVMAILSCQLDLTIFRMNYKSELERFSAWFDVSESTSSPNTGCRKIILLIQIFEARRQHDLNLDLEVSRNRLLIQILKQKDTSLIQILRWEDTCF